MYKSSTEPAASRRPNAPFIKRIGALLGSVSFERSTLNASASLSISILSWKIFQNYSLLPAVERAIVGRITVTTVRLLRLAVTTFPFAALQPHNNE